MVLRMESDIQVFKFAYGAALSDGSLYASGVALDLEDRDVPHTILWERVGGEWKRFQWKNRTYGLAAYPHAGAGTAVYMGYEGTLKVRNSVLGSSEERVASGDDAPSSLRTVSSVRVIGDQIFVAGMRRMVFRRSLSSSAWLRSDSGVAQDRRDLTLAGFYSIDGESPDFVYAVGIGGEAWRQSGGVWNRLDSPTNLTWLSLRHLGSGKFALGGEQGLLWLHENGVWQEVQHDFSNETFSCIETWQGRNFVSADSGDLFELHLGGSRTLKKIDVPGMPRVSWLASTAERLWLFGGTRVLSLSPAGWQDESPPSGLLS